MLRTLNQLYMDIIKEITQDIETGINVASFEYYNGIDYANRKGLEQTTHFKEVFAGTHFIVCCGDIMVKVEPSDFPDIERRLF